MKWLDIMQGEVRAKRETLEHAREQRQNSDKHIHQRSLEAALEFVVRPALEHAAAELKRRRINCRIQEHKGTLSMEAASKSDERLFKLSFTGDPAKGLVRVDWTLGEAVQKGSDRVSAGALSPTVVQHYVSTLDAGRQPGH